VIALGVTIRDSTHIDGAVPDLNRKGEIMKANSKTDLGDMVIYYYDAEGWVRGAGSFSGLKLIHSRRAKIWEVYILPHPGSTSYVKARRASSSTKADALVGVFFGGAEK
jgi:hypothetical protein